MTSISRERAQLIAKSHACANCGEFSWKKVRVAPASESQREALSIAWMVHQVCGVCDHHMEVGIADDGDIVFAA